MYELTTQQKTLYVFTDGDMDGAQEHLVQDENQNILKTFTQPWGTTPQEAWNNITNKPARDHIREHGWENAGGFTHAVAYALHQANPTDEDIQHFTEQRNQLIQKLTNPTYGISLDEPDEDPTDLQNLAWINTVLAAANNHQHLHQGLAADWNNWTPPAEENTP